MTTDPSLKAEAIRSPGYRLDQRLPTTSGRSHPC